MSFDDTTHSLAVGGDVDETGAAALRQEIETRSGSYANPIVVDLSEVQYLPSGAVGVLATSQKKASENGTSVELVAAEGSIAERVLRVCALPYRTA